MIMSIHTMNATQDSDEFSVLCYVLRAIVYEIEPIPLATVDLQTGLQVHESHRKRRRSSAGERSPLEISDIPRRKLGRFETRTRVTHANTYANTPQRLHRPDPVSPLHCSTSQTLLYLTPEQCRTTNRLLSSGAPKTLTLTRHKSTRPTLSSYSPRQCSACRQSVSRSLTPGVPSVVLAISTRCLTLRHVAPCPSKEHSALPHNQPNVANSDLLDSTPSSYPASVTRRSSGSPSSALVAAPVSRM